MRLLDHRGRVFVYGHPVDMRKGFIGLQALVQHQLGEDPMSGDLFVFLMRGPVHRMARSRPRVRNDSDIDRQHAGDTLKAGVQGAPAGPGGPVPASLSAGGPDAGRQHLQPRTQLLGVPAS